MGHIQFPNDLRTTWHSSLSVSFPNQFSISKISGVVDHFVSEQKASHMKLPAKCE